MIGNLPVAGLKTLHHRSDWNTARLKFLFQRVVRAAEDEAGIVTAFRDGVVTLRSNRREDGFTFAEKEIGYQGVKAGDLVIHAMDGFAGAIGVSDSDGKVSPVLTVLTPTENAFPKFWGYYLRSLALSGFITSLAKGIRERSTDFRWKDAGNLLVNYPDLPTQRAIADFLDRETARIDTLIEKKQRLVELLGEKKKAALSRIEEELYSFETGASRLSYHVSKVGSGKTPSGGANVYQDSGIIFLRSQNIKNDSISLDDVAYISEEIDAEMSGSRVKGGDVLLNITGASLGRCAVAPLDLPSANVNQHVCIIRPARHLLAEYLHVLLLAPRMQATIKTEAFSAGREGLNFQSIRNFLIPVPQSVKVQASIVDRISRITTQDGKIIAVSERSIDRLKEYRSALITSAVTGQIDVTKWTNAETTDRQLDAIEEEFGA